MGNWKPDDARAFFDGRLGTMIADASGGKALRLQQTSGTWLEHVSKGGVVAYFIVAVGVLALVIVIGKVRDLAQMKVEGREAVQQALDYNVPWYLARPSALMRVLQDSYRLDARG